MSDDGLPEAGSRRSPVTWLWVLLIGMYLALYILPLNERPLFIPDESRYAQIPREMVDAGDWSELRQVGLRYYEKPPLGYWLIAASLSAFGYNNFAVRLPNALAVGLTALAILLFVRRWRRDETTGLTAAFIYLTSAEVFGIGTFTVLDTMFSLFVGLSMLAFFLGRNAVGGDRTAWLILSGLSCGLSFLAKGFTGAVIPALTLLAWLIWEKRPRDLLTAWLIPVAAAFLTVLPFGLILHANNEGFWNYFIWIEHVQRFLSPHGGQHNKPFWFYVPVFASMSIPWVFFLPAAVGEMKRRASGDSLTRYCLCWFVMPFLFFSACGGKLLTYILPCFAPFAILMAEALLGDRRETLLRRCALGGAAIMGVALVGFLAWLPFADKRGAHLRESLLADGSIWWLGTALVLTVVSLYIASRVFRRSGKRLAAIFWVGFSMFSIMFASFHFMPTGIENNKAPERLLAPVLSHIPEDAVLFADRPLAPSVAWHTGRTDVLMFGSYGELEYGLLNFPEGKGRFLGSAQDAGVVIRTMVEGGRAAAVCLHNEQLAELTAAVGREPTLRAFVEPYVWLLYIPAKAAH